MDSLLSGGDYNQLRAFVAVGELLSFSRAAEALGVSPSALSQMVRGFEERVGVRLLNRTTRSVALTDAGENLFDACGRRCRNSATPSGRCAAIASGRQASCASTPFDRPPEPISSRSCRLSREAYPDVVLDITLDDEVVDVVAGGFDVGHPHRRGDRARHGRGAARRGAASGRGGFARLSRRFMAVRSTRAISSAIAAFDGAGPAARRPTPGSFSRMDPGSRLWWTAP